MFFAAYLPAKDVPLLNLDWVNAFGKETQIVELYDTQLAPYPAEKLAAFDALRARDADLPDPPAGKAHWYDAILYPCGSSPKPRTATPRPKPKRTAPLPSGSSPRAAPPSTR